MSLTSEQRKFFDDLDDFTEQAFLSGQYSGLVLGKMRQWAAEGKFLSIDALVEWANERERDEWSVGFLCGLAQAVRHDDDSEAAAPQSISH